MKKFLKRRPGFTLIEVIIYIAISAVMVVTLLNIMLNVIEHREKTQVSSAVQQNLRFTMQRITQTGYNALEVQTGATLFNTSSGSLTFTMSGAAVTPTVYFLSGNTIFETIGSNAATALTADTVRVNQFELTNLTATGSATTVKVELNALQIMDTDLETYTDDMYIFSSFTIRK